jgi:hypothetical protein
MVWTGVSWRVKMPNHVSISTACCNLQVASTPSGTVINVLSQGLPKGIAFHLHLNMQLETHAAVLDFV